MPVPRMARIILPRYLGFREMAIKAKISETPTERNSPRLIDSGMAMIRLTVEPISSNLLTLADDSQK